MKKIGTLMLVGAMCLSMAGCRDKEADGNNTQSASTQASATENVMENDNEEALDNTQVEDGNNDVEETVDIASMTYDEAEAYLDSLPDTDVSYFEIETEGMPEGEATISAYNGEDKIVVIPETIDGKTITKIDIWAFTNNEDIVAVKAPETLTVLGDNAFVNCYSLVYVTNLENLETMGDAAFLACGVRYFVFSEKLVNIDDMWGECGDNLHVKAPKDSAIAIYAKELNESWGEEAVILEEY